MAKRAAGFVIFRFLSATEVEYLLLRASYGDFHWSFPKGLVEKGEDDYAAALRETKEEVGYSERDLIIDKGITHVLKYNVKDKPKISIYWPAELIDAHKEPVLSDEHTEMRWLSKDDAKKLIGFKDAQDMIEEFHNIIQYLK